MTLSAFALVLPLLGSGPRVEPPIVWESRGPAYTAVDAVVAGADDDTVYAAARDAESGASALFRTTDGGNHWDLLAPAPEGERIRQVVIDPTDARRMLALTAFAAGVRIYRSDDAGATWRLKTSLAEGDGSESLFFDPVHPDLAFLDAWDSDLNARALSSSLEDGPWSSIGRYGHDRLERMDRPGRHGDLDGPHRVLYGIACYPGSIDLLAGRDPTSARTRGRRTMDAPQEVFCLGMNVTYDPTNPSLAYGSGFSCPDLLRSEDGGKTWAQWDPSGSLGRLIHGSPGRRIARTAVSGSGSPALYALALATTSSDTGGILVSHDGGRSWAQLPNPCGTVTALALGASGTLYVGTSSGVFQVRRTRTVHRE